MKTSEYFFILSGIYVAPHLDQIPGIAWAAIFSIAAIFFAIKER